MRLDRLDLTRYGRFTDISLTLAPPAAGRPDLHVIYGPNEAGKSTLFSAWLDLLYGIPVQTRYSFLHKGPAMRIGARISHAAGTADINRLKRRTGSLVDAHDAPLPEARVESLLGGLSRQGYTAMFSLDDETLEKGGDSILASQGDLGEMLFSASAGLAGLGPQLDAVRGELDSFHAAGKRSGWLSDTKRKLGELDAQRRGLETSANALKVLIREADATDAARHEARAAERQADISLTRMRELALTLPMARKLQTCLDRLAPMAHLPDVASGVQDDFDGLDRQTAILDTRLQDHGLRIANLHDDLAHVQTDLLMLAQAGPMEGAQRLFSEHDSAANDLPRRRQAADAAQLAIRQTLAELDHGEAQARDLVVPAPRMSGLRRLLAKRSGLEGAVASAKAETARAAVRLGREREASGDIGPDDDDGILQALIAQMQRHDPADLHRTALRDVHAAEAAWTAAIAALAPWQGDAGTLTALPVPSDGQIAEWDTASEAVRQSLLDTRRTADDLRAVIVRAADEHGVRRRGQDATGVTLADATAARTRREAAWAMHRTCLSHDTAQQFERTLREDDRIGALLAEAMADARRSATHEATQETLTARAELAEAQVQRQQTAQHAIRIAVAAAGDRLGLRDAAPADLRRWLPLRQAALSAQDVLRGAQVAVERAHDAMTAAAGSLRAALGPDAPTDAGYDILLAHARGRLAVLDQRRVARRHLRDLASDLREREQALSGADAALAEWRTAWAGGPGNRDRHPPG